MESQPAPEPVVDGWADFTVEPDWPEAVYRSTEIDRYNQDPNPLIMALPPIADEFEAVQALTNIVTATNEQRAKPGFLRQHELGAVEEFFQPLDDHIDLYQRIGVMLRSGYVRRNPVRAAYLRQLDECVREIDRVSAGKPRPPSPYKANKAGSNCLTLLGLSGVGKTKAAEAVVATYPQVIRHPRLKGPFQSMVQVVWLYVICPEDASQKGLLIEIIAALDKVLGTNYWQLYVTRGATIATLRAALARLAYVHGIGLIVIDEVQHLNNAKAGGAEIMIDFFKILSDVVMVPLLMVGTDEADAKLSGSFQSARRHSGLPLFAPMPLYVRDDAGQPEVNPNYRFFYESMFQAQYLQEPIEPDDLLLKQLHFMTVGVRAIDVKLFWLTQLRALAIGAERLTIELFRSVFDDCFRPLHKPLRELRDRAGATAPAGWSDSFGKFMKDSVATERLARAVSQPLVPPKAQPERSPRATKKLRSKRPEQAPEQVNDDGAEEEGDSDDGVRLPEIVAAGKEGGLTGYESLQRARLVMPLGEQLLSLG